MAFEAASGPIPVIASGTVQPRDVVVIGAQVGGRLAYVHPQFREGGVVPAGATVLRIEPTDFQNQVRIAEADVAAQNVAVLQAQEEVAIAQDELARFAEREAAVAGLSSIDDNDYAARIMPPERLARSNAPASGQQASSSVLASREPQLRSARAARERASANLAVAQLSLSRTRVAAPFRGLVQEENIAVGTLVQPGQALGTLVDARVFEVRLSLTPDEAALIPGLMDGSGARIPADVFYNYGGLTYRWPARIDRADASLDPETRNVEIFLQVPNPMGGGQLVAEEGEVPSASPAPPLLLGAFVRAQINGAVLDSYAAIPAQALRPGNEVWVVRDGVLRILPVRVIRRDDEFAYISTPSLAEGGRIITSSLNAPTDGMAVRLRGDAG